VKFFAVLTVLHQLHYHHNEVRRTSDAYCCESFQLCEVLPIYHSSISVVNVVLSCCMLVITHIILDTNTLNQDFCYSAT